MTPARAAANCGFVAKYTAISRKVVGKNVYPTIPKGNVGYDQYTVPDTVAVDGTYFSCFPNLALANSYFHGLSCHSSQISLKNSELKTTHSTYRDALFPTTFFEIVYTYIPLQGFSATIYLLGLIYKKYEKSNEIMN